MSGATRRDFLRSAALLPAVAGALAPAREAAAAPGPAAAGTPQRFRIGYQIFGWGRYFPAAWWKGARACGALGYAGIEGEYTIAELYEGREDEFAERMQACGVALAALYTTSDLERPRESWENARKNMMAARFCQRMGASVLVLGGTEAVSKDGDTFAAFARAANDLGRRLHETHGVRLALHPHLGALVETREDLARVMDATDPRALWLAPDTGHLLAGGSDPVEVFETYGARIVHAHLKDYAPAPAGGRGAFLPLGAGRVDFPALLRLSRARGFDGWLAIELDGGRGVDPATAARGARDYVTTTLGAALVPGRSA